MAFLQNARRKKGASLVEMVISLFILGIVLFGIMMAMLRSDEIFYTKEGEEAKRLGLNILDSFESVTSPDWASLDIAVTRGIYTITVEPSSDVNPSSSVVKVTIDWPPKNQITMEREVSFSAWQNAGVFPPEP